MPGGKNQVNQKSLDLTVSLIKRLLPLIDLLVPEIVASGGYLNFHDQIISFCATGEGNSWAQFYDSRKRLRALMAYALYDEGELKMLEAESRQLAPENIFERREENKEKFLRDLPSFEEIASAKVNPDLQEEFRLQLDTLSEDERHALTEDYTVLFYFVITHICTYLALMTFGESMCSLVEKAKAGDDASYCKAVQIDRSLLFSLPYFRQRLIKAQLGSEPKFLRKLGAAIAGKSLAGKLDYPKLRLVFAMLDDEGYLDIPLDTLLNVCEELGVYGRDYGVEDTESLRKIRQSYRRKTGRQKQL